MASQCELRTQTRRWSIGIAFDCAGKAAGQEPLHTDTITLIYRRPKRAAFAEKSLGVMARRRTRGGWRRFLAISFRSVSPGQLCSRRKPAREHAGLSPA